MSTCACSRFGFYCWDAVFSAAFEESVAVMDGLVEGLSTAEAALLASAAFLAPAMGSFLFVLREMATATPPLTELPIRCASLRLTPPTIAWSFLAAPGAASEDVVAGRFLVSCLVSLEDGSGVRIVAALREPLPRFDTGNPWRKDGVVAGDVDMAARFCCVTEARPLSAPLPDRTCGGLYWKCCCCLAIVMESEACTRKSCILGSML